jgi:membrane protease YdiL (CAAX protease family)
MVDQVLPLIVLLLVGGASSLAFSDAYAAKPAVLWVLLGTYAVLGAVSVWRMWRDGTLLDLFRWRSGDIATGAVGALGLGVGMYLGRQFICPRGSPSESWVVRFYLQIGDVPADRSRMIIYSLALVLLAVLEEVVWRGMVQQIFEERLGIRRGWVAATMLYALAQVPTVWALAMPPMGKNPLVVLGTLLCGAVWGFLAARKQRLAPALVSHALFLQGIVVHFRLWSP